LTFSAAGQFRAGKSFADILAHFSVAGGMPAYWLQFDPGKDFAQNLKDHVVRKGSVLYDEVEFILREELREPRYYFALLQAVAQGKRKLSEIVNATGLSQPVANKYLGVLADLKIVERELPATEETPLKSKKGLYRITDEFFHFWFKFVFPRRADLEMGRTEDVSAAVVRDLPRHLSGVYEKVAVETLWRNRDRFFPFSVVGRWWDRSDEIDIIAVNRELDCILFGEVKWSEKAVGIDIYEALKRKVSKVAYGSKERKEIYCLFSKKGFTNGMLEKAGSDGVVLFKEDVLIEHI
jgi:AAA+ ATPase superfamily predicted ATPase